MTLPFFIQHLDASVKKFRLVLVIDEIRIVKLDSIRPGLPGTCFISRSCWVMGCQSSFWAWEGDTRTAEIANSRKKRIGFNAKTSAQSKGKFVCKLYNKKGSVTRVSGDLERWDMRP